MNCIIVDDEVNSNLLGSLVSKCLSLNLIGIYNDPASALYQLSKRNNIDLAFIDINIAGMDSLNKINRLENPPYLIAVSADGQNAMKAYDYNFIDYLIKPVSYSRLYRAVDRTIKYNVKKDILNSGDKEIFIKKDISLFKVKMKDITYIEALENYIILNTLGKKYTIHFTMKCIESQLPPEMFIRVHRSFIVNKKLIKTINENHLQIILGDYLQNLPIGKSFRNSIVNDLSVINR